MRGLVDYHTHSLLSDGLHSYEAMVCAAIEKGLDEIGFSDHICLKPVSWAIQEIDLPVMTRQIQEVKKKYSHLINVKYGIELDYFPGHEKQLAQIINSLPLDYTIGAVHFIDGWNFDGDKSLYGKWTNDKLYAIYFELVQQAAQSQLFDIIGHLDIIKKFGVYPETDQGNLFVETARVLQKTDVVIELNTGGLDRPCSEFMPSQRWLEILHTHGIQVTISSDAHHSDQVARHFEPAVELLRKVGYHEIVKFDKHKRSAFKI